LSKSTIFKKAQYLSDTVSEVTTKTVRLDESAIVLGSADQVRSRDDESLSGSQADQENSQLKFKIQNLL
jgi:hypothetical protein